MLKTAYLSTILFIIMHILMIQSVIGTALPMFQASESVTKKYSQESEQIHGGGEGILDDIFAKIGCKWEQVNVNGWARLRSEPMDMATLEKIAFEAASFFQLAEGYELSKNKNGHISQVFLRGYSSDSRTVTLILNNDNRNSTMGADCETHMVVDLVERDQSFSSEVIRKGIDDFFSKWGVKPSVSVTFTGTYPCNMSRSEKYSLCRDIFMIVEGEATQSIEQEDLISCAGYSPLLPGALTSKEGPVNLNAALRYSGYWGKTYVWIGSPVITTGY